MKDKITLSNQNSLFLNYPDVMEVKQVMSALGISRHGVYDLINSGELKCFKLCSKYKVTKTALVEFIQKKECR